VTSRKQNIIFIIVTLILAGWLAGLYAFVNDLTAMSSPKPEQNVDAIVVLTGGSNRIDVGFNLLNQGYGQKLFISGVYKGVDVKRLLKRWKAEPKNKIDCCVEIGVEAVDTVGNAVETAEWLHKQGFHSIYLVTANYHIRRALLEFGRLAPDVALTPYPVIPEKYDNLLIMREYAKYLVAYVRSLL
jgi:uncharacterized SAM-binding protein YcdF (DUF218 family)